MKGLERFESEVAKVSPEGHRNWDGQKLFCPWAWKDVGVTMIQMGEDTLKGPVCNGCLRPVNLQMARLTQ